MTIPRRRPALSLSLATALALGAVFVSAERAPTLADSRPEIVDVRLNNGGRAVVTWTKEPWQASVGVRWSAGDSRVGVPDDISPELTGLFDHFGYPLLDCLEFRGPDPVLLGVGDYGDHCKGQDAASGSDGLVIAEKLSPGVYYFQVMVWGRFDASDPCFGESCAFVHYSDVYEFTVLPDGGEQPSPSDQPSPSERPDDNAPQTLVGPERVGLAGGGQVDVRAGGQVVANGRFNFEVRFGQMHLRENLVTFRCPPWMEPFPPETTLRGWIGVRCRTVTTPQAGALVRGTEFSVTVSDEATVFQVFDGQLEISDLDRQGAVTVGPGETTTVPSGGLPTTPIAFDASDPTLRWWEGALDLELAAAVAIVLIVLLVLLVLYFVPLIVALTRRQPQWRAVALVDLFTGWTVIGWIVALALALTLPGRKRADKPVLWSDGHWWSSDGRWWWDGRAWQPRDG